MRTGPRGGRSLAPPRSWLVVLVVAIATLVGTWVRVALAFSSGLWRDEVQSLAISQLPTAGAVVSFLAREDSHPPLFYLVERTWVRLFGSSDAAVIALGLVPGVLLIPMAALIAYRLAGRRAGNLAAWYSAVAWPLVWHAGDGRPYSFLSFASLLTATAGYFAASSGSVAWWAAYGSGCLILLYTHNWWVLVVAALAAVTLFTCWRTNRGDRASLRPWLITHAALAVLYLPWLPIVVSQGRAAGYAEKAQFPVEWLVVAPVMVLGVALPLLLPSVALLILGQYRSSAPRGVPGAGRFYGLVVGLSCLMALAAWKFTDLTMTHCAAALASLGVIAVACGLGSEARPGTSVRRLMASALFLIVLAASMGQRWHRKSDVREAATQVSALANAHDLVIVYPSSIGPVFQRYLSSGSRVAVFPPQHPIMPTSYRNWWRRFDDPGAVDETFKVIDAARREGRDVWFVNQLRVDHSPDSSAPVGTRERFRYSVGARRADITTRLRALYGPPDPLDRWRRDEWRRELVEVMHYGENRIGARFGRTPIASAFDPSGH